MVSLACAKDCRHYFHHMQDKNVGKLVEEAEKRKEKLAKLKSKRLHRNEDESEKMPVFRNYAPTDVELQHGMLPHLKPSEVDEKIKEQISLTQSNEKLTNKIEMNLSTLAPRKIDWDLKRDISQRLEKLEKRTQKAIAELIRERLLQTQDFSAVPDMEQPPLHTEEI